MSVGICVLAYGEEHIKELNKLSATLGEVNLYVYTDIPDMVEKAVTISDGEEFNFNLKRKCIKEALRHHDVVVCMDSDILFKRKFDFNSLNNLRNGLHAKWVGTVQNIKKTKTSIGQVINGTTKFDDLNTHGKSLVECGANVDNILFFDEFLFVLKIDDIDKENFINQWEYIDFKTRESHIKHKNGQYGGIESLVISLACHLSKINLYYGDIPLLYESIVHYNSMDYSKNLI